MNQPTDPLIEREFARVVESCGLNLGRTYTNPESLKVQLVKIVSTQDNFLTIGALVTCRMTIYVSVREAGLDYNPSSPS